VLISVTLPADLGRPAQGMSTCAIARNFRLQTFVA
jgi:hypothetical protein